MDKSSVLQSSLRIEDVPTVRAMVARKLREAIMSGTLKPGQRLVERELCELTGVSRPSIREALRLLEADGLVNTVPHRGPMVSTISLEEAKQLYAARAVLEGFAGRECARLRDPVVVRGIGDALTRHDRITLLRITSMSHPKRINKSLREVTAIWRAIQNGDEDLAERCCVDHVKAAAVAALDMIERSAKEKMPSDE